MDNSGEPEAALAALEALWNEVGPVERSVTRYALSKALQVGDRELALRWADRHVQAYPWMRAQTASSLAAGPETRVEGIRRLRAEIERSQTGKGSADGRPPFVTAEDHRAHLEAEVGRLQAALGTALLEGDDAAGALGPLEEAAASSWDVSLLRSLATARLAAGDSLGAAEALARVVVDPGVANPNSLLAQGLRLVGDPEWSGLMTKAASDLQEWTLQSADSRPFPAGVTLLDTDGERVVFKSILNDDGPTVVVLYSQYCGYSVAATRRIEALRRRLSPEGARVVVVAAEPPREDGESFLDEHGYSGLVYHDVDREVSHAFGSLGSPHYFVLDRSGAVRYEFTSLEEIPRQVAALRVGGGQSAQ